MSDFFAGYPVIHEKTDWYKQNPHVSGMASGGFDTNEDPYISINGWADQMQDPRARRGLMRIEASRHLMHETEYNPKWEITPAQKEWQKTFAALEGGHYYANNIDNSFRETLISRSIGMNPARGDERNFTWDNQTVQSPKTGEMYVDESIPPIPLTKPQIKDRDMFDQMIVNRQLIDKVKQMKKTGEA